MNKVFLVLLLLTVILINGCDFIPKNKEEVKNENIKQDVSESEVVVRKKRYDNGKIMTEVPYKGNVKHGIARHYYKNGIVSMEIPYINGKKHGKVMYYYQDGKIFRITPYVNGRKHGIREKYYQGGDLMAKIPYRNDNPVPGLKEWTKDGTLLTKYPTLEFKKIDKISSSSKIILQVYLSDKTKNVEFFRKYISEQNDTVKMALQAQDGILELDFYVPEGKSISEAIEIVAIKKTRRKNPYVVNKTYKLYAENN